jgi:hypothetical protein
MQRYKLDEYKEGRNLLDRCDKLLNSIAEITAANELQQPSPVSVLDSSFYKDEWCSPSPITKRCIDYNFKGKNSRVNTIYFLENPNLHGPIILKSGIMTWHDSFRSSLVSSKLQTLLL